MNSVSFRFGTVGSPTSTPKKPGGSVGAVLRLREMNLGGLELGWVRSVRVSEDTCLKIKEAAQEKDVLISVHAPYFINLNADDEEWPKSRKRLMDAAYSGNLAGATDVVFHPGSYFRLEPGEVLPKAISRLEGCVQELRENGNPVVLRPETMGKSAMLGSLQDTIEMSKKIPGVLPCLDFAHLHARTGNGTLNSYEEWARLLETYAQELGDSALVDIHAHLSGIEYTEKGEKNHLLIEESDFDMRGLFQALSVFKCRGRILCESPNLEDDAILMQSVWLEVSGESSQG